MSDVTYFKVIGATSVVRNRVKEIRSLYARLLPPKILTDLFISETRDAQGEHVWQSVWLYGPSYVGEARNFLSETTFDGAPVREVNRWEFAFQDYAPGREASEKSRATLTFELGNDVTGKLSATGPNCDYLVRLFEAVCRPKP
jgi:hypothetical protein